MEFSDKVKVWLTCPKTHSDKVRLEIGRIDIEKYRLKAVLF